MAVETTGANSASIDAPDWQLWVLTQSACVCVCMHVCVCVWFCVHFGLIMNILLLVFKEEDNSVIENIYLLHNQQNSKANSVFCHGHIHTRQMLQL